MRKTKLHRFRDDVRRYLDLQRRVKEQLPAEGQALVQMLCGEYADLTLTELARRTKLSKTYLSRVANGHETISPGAYLRLWAFHDRART